MQPSRRVLLVSLLKVSQNADPVILGEAKDLGISIVRRPEILRCAQDDSAKFLEALNFILSRTFVIVLAMVVFLTASCTQRNERHAATARNLASTQDAKRDLPPLVEHAKIGIAPPTSAPAAAEYECRFTENPITIDGAALEGDWSNATVVDHFTLPWLGAGNRPAKTATKAKLLWDREYLYFFAEMEDSDLYADVKDHDGEVWNNDCFELFFKPAQDKPGYYEFEVSPANTVLDMFLPSRNSGGYPRYKGDGEFGIKTAVQLRGTLNNWSDKDQGWSVEGRIPWKSMIRTGGRPNPDEVWTYALCRGDVSVGMDGQELSTSVPKSDLTYPNFHHYEDYTPIRFVGPEKSASAAQKPYGIETLIPWTTSKVVGSPDPPHPYRLVQAFPKLKIKYPINVTTIPGTDQMLLIAEDFSYGPAHLYQLADDESVETPIKLLDFDGIAYSFAFHPNFKENGFVYIGQNGPGATDASRSKVIRYHIDSKTAKFDPASATEIIGWKSNGHNGAAVDFGPDGMFYVTSGDGTSDSDQWISGQDLTRPLSKLMRIDVDHPADGKQYSVPKDNPFLDRKGAVPETYAYGFRNPWRMSIDQETGQIWVAQNGQDNWEQAYLVERGANYGWSTQEGSHPFRQDHPRGPDPITPPTVEHSHAVARSLTGGRIYHGTKTPELRGAYLYGDYSTGKIWSVRVDPKTKKVNEHIEIADSTAQITSFGLDSNGELLITDHGGGKLMRLEPTPKDLPHPVFPTMLSETGLFTSVKGHVVAPGMIPYSVRSEQWVDGAFVERFIGIPAKDGRDNRIDYTGLRGWTLPDESVAIESLGLEFVAGKPESRRWVETRLMTRQEGEWVGYSYAWNTEQSEATLVDGGGRDAEFVLVDPNSVAKVHKQRWRFASRSECMNCHSRAVNYLLGMQTVQMNCDFNYGGGRIDNQLRTLEHLGLFRVNWAGEANAMIRDDGKVKGLEKEQLDAWVTAQTATRDQREAPQYSPLLAQAPDQLKKMVDPRDTAADVQARAKSYLHANCSHCHVEAGGGNSTMELEFTTALSDMRVVDFKPLHGDFNLPNARIVAPGAPDDSVMLHRMSQRGAAQMPPLGTTVPDTAAIALLREWIAQVKKPDELAPSASK